MTSESQPFTEEDVERLVRPCYAEHRGMLCDRLAGHIGDHVDIYGPLPDHTWADEPVLDVQASTDSAPPSDQELTEGNTP